MCFKPAFVFWLRLRDWKSDNMLGWSMKVSLKVELINATWTLILLQALPKYWMLSIHPMLPGLTYHQRLTVKQQFSSRQQPLKLKEINTVMWYSTELWRNCFSYRFRSKPDWPARATRPCIQIHLRHQFWVRLWLNTGDAEENEAWALSIQHLLTLKNINKKVIDKTICLCKGIG